MSTQSQPTQQVPAEITAAFAADPRITTVVSYDDGFVPNMYGYRAPGMRTVYGRDGSIRRESYDRRRSFLRPGVPRYGRTIIGRSARGGRLYSR